MCKFLRQPICGQRLKATRLITVYGLRLDCTLKGQRKQATSLLRQEQELDAAEGKIGIFLPLRTCCSATKLLLMRPVQAVKGLGAGCPAAPFAKHNRANRGFLTVNEPEGAPQPDDAPVARQEQKAPLSATGNQ